MGLGLYVIRYLSYLRDGRRRNHTSRASGRGVLGRHDNVVAWASLLTLPRTVTTDAAGAVAYGNVYTQLLEYIISADLVFYSLMVGAVIILRRKAPEAERPYRTVGYPVTPFIFLSVAALLILDLAYLAPTTSGIGFLLRALRYPRLFRLAEPRASAQCRRKRGDTGYLNAWPNRSVNPTAHKTG